MTDKPVQRYSLLIFDGRLYEDEDDTGGSYCHASDVSALEAENILLNALADVVQGAMDDGNMNEDGDGFVISLADYRQIQSELKALAAYDAAKSGAGEGVKP